MRTETERMCDLRAPRRGTAVRPGPGSAAQVTEGRSLARGNPIKFPSHLRRGVHSRAPRDPRIASARTAGSQRLGDRDGEVGEVHVLVFGCRPGRVGACGAEREVSMLSHGPSMGRATSKKATGAGCALRVKVRLVVSAVLAMGRQSLR